MLIACALLVFSVLAWQAVVWSLVVPAADLTAEVLQQRARSALAARREGRTLPPETRFETSAPQEPRRWGNYAYAVYVDAVRRDLGAALQASDVRVIRVAAPSEIWVKLGDGADDWLVLTWRLAGPRTPFAAIVVLVAGALVVLGGAALSARRLTAPLASLAGAAGRVAQGEVIQSATLRGPREVRSLASAFQSMSQQLAEADEQRELMLGGISHDLRTPLARVRVAIDLLDHGDASLIEEMTASVEEMDRMIGQFLHYVRAGYREKPSPASLDEVLSAALAAHRADARLQWRWAAPDMRSFAVECARHCVLNLVQNALEYGVSPIEVGTAATPTSVLLRVTDCGPGLDAAQWLEALRPFRRLHTAPAAGHSGLGLALIDRLVRSCGGTLHAERTPLHFIVTVTLPTA
jgi:two-component system osmolarity sensor histidine kinase EnvZ